MSQHAVMAATPAPVRPLSFGVEIEGIADKPRSEIKKAIDRARLSGVVVRLIEGEDHPKGPRDEWIVTDDGTIKTYEGKQWDNFGERHSFELASPTLFDDHAGGTARWRSEIPAVMKAINDGGISTETNKSTALQVHVGVGREEQYEVDELRRILMFVVIYEPEIDKYHAAHRSASWAASTEKKNNMTQSNRKNAKWENTAIDDILDQLTEAQDKDMLIRLMNPPQEVVSGPLIPNRQYKLNCTSLDKHGTLEFRQHEGTTNPDTICRWVEFVLCLVRGALSLTVEQIRNLNPRTTPLVPTFVPNICVRRAPIDSFSS